MEGFWMALACHRWCCWRVIGDVVIRWWWLRLRGRRVGRWRWRRWRHRQSEETTSQKSVLLPWYWDEQSPVITTVELICKNSQSRRTRQKVIFRQNLCWLLPILLQTYANSLIRWYLFDNVISGLKSCSIRHCGVRVCLQMAAGVWCVTVVHMFARRGQQGSV